MIIYIYRYDWKDLYIINGFFYIEYILYFRIEIFIFFIS